MGAALGELKDDCCNCIGARFYAGPCAFVQCTLLAPAPVGPPCRMMPIRLHFWAGEGRFIALVVCFAGKVPPCQHNMSISTLMMPRNESICNFPRSTRSDSKFLSAARDKLRVFVDMELDLSMTGTCRQVWVSAYTDVAAGPGETVDYWYRWRQEGSGRMQDMNLAVRVFLAMPFKQFQQQQLQSSLFLVVAG